METLQKAIQKMGSNFIVASFVPAMGFVVCCIIAFLPIIPASLVEIWKRIGENFIEVSVVVLLFTTLIGFTLFTLSTFIYKAFEGYTFILGRSTPFGKAGLRRQKKRVKRIVIDKRRISRALCKLEDRMRLLTAKPEKDRTASDWIRLRRYQLKLERLKSRQYAHIADYNQNFPDRDLILPTRFGNVLRASERYPGKMYGIDAVVLWPRLAHVIPPEGMALVDQSNNECLFLLNSSLLATLLALLSLFAAAYQYLLSILKPNHNFLLYEIPLNLGVPQYQVRVGIYLVVFLIAIVVALFFYEASLLNVGQYGDMIRSSYDMYRFKLIEALHLKLPSTLMEEYELWEKISSFYAIGNEIDSEINFHYSHQK